MKYLWLANRCVWKIWRSVPKIQQTGDGRLYRAVEHHGLRHVRRDKVVEPAQRPGGCALGCNGRQGLEAEDGVDVFFPLRYREVAPS